MANQLVKSRLWMVFIVAVFMIAASGVITCVNVWTSKIIARNEEISIKKSVLNAFNIPYAADEITAVFDKDIKSVPYKNEKVFLYYAGGMLKGVAFKIKGPGFWGPIEGMLALTPDLRKILGIEILAQEETPGLGGRITEPWFKAQFRGKDISVGIKFDAITGATMTSTAFKKLLEETISSFRSDVKDIREVLK